jgi:arylsulfatase A-like enzyme
MARFRRWVLGTAWLPLAACAASEAPPRNLLLIVADTLRADHVGHQGYPRDTSPRLDALAESGAVFLRHYSHSSRTEPSVASLLTGLHPRSHGVLNPLDSYDAKGTLQASQTTLAELLAERGFTTAGFVTNPNISRRFGFAQGFATYDLIASMRGDELNASALRWLDAADEPFFLYLHYVEPHSDYDPPVENRYLFADPLYDGPADGSAEQIRQVELGRWSPAPADLAHLVALYDQEIRTFDDRLGEVLDELERRGLADSTLVVVTSDHGEEFLEHGSVFHGYTLYEEQLRVPLVLRDPRRRGGVRVETITRHVDLLPTLLDLLGVETPAGLQGASLVPLLEGAGAPHSEPAVFAEVSVHGTRIVKLRSLSRGGWKLVESDLPERGHQLYRVARDPREQRDLSAQRARVLEQMRDELRRFSRELPVAEGASLVLSEEEREQLRSLGYLPPQESPQPGP